MFPYQIDLEKQCLDPYDPGHNYAWTNTYLVETAGDDDAQLILERLVEIEAGVLPNDTQIRFACWRHGIGTPLPTDIQVIGRFGDLPPTASYQPMFNTARIVGYSGRKLVWYKRWRGPLRDVDMTGDMLSNDYFERLNTDYVERLRLGIPLITRSGGLITRWEVSPRITLWQRRHGTRRDVQSPLAG